ncbi:ATP-binding cassette domain-containing protein [Mycoplasma sp. 2704]|uniref:ATP-binding cassette domain-containing protein n=1 Tax=Mycoplasma sp. 2704 TaxID=3108529 RepID=UPI002B1CF6C3|nr:ATP-binding cassette domain-containing protein [Mycoplasma sp. 2704]MEA4134739.1 ATP-binding cassette domain-containing protein [Mycoplasma sp. 2704]
MKQNFYAIEFDNISKSFGSIKANQNISFKVEKGTVHALIGENGAGKSTLMSILFGLYEPDEGIIKVNEKEVLIKGPNDANRLGIGMVHQHFKLVDVYTNLENIVLGAEDRNKFTRIIDFKPAIEKIKTIQEMFDLHFDLNRLTGKETVATQQKVEIMKMLYRDSDILIFDEPTAVLTDQEIQGLLNTFKLFREQGKTILFISHKLAEIKEVADNATVLRHGKVVGNFEVADVSIEEMANRMVGGDVEIIRNEYSDTSQNEVVFKLDNVSTDGEKPLKNVNLEIRSGEIVAIAGVEGNGQTDLEKVVSGMIKPTTGQVLYKKTPLVKERMQLIQKSKTRKNIIMLLISLFVFLYSGLGLLAAANYQSDSTKAIMNIGGGLAISFSIILLMLILFSIYGPKFKEKTIFAKTSFQKQMSKRQLLVFKILFLVLGLVSGFAVLFAALVFTSTNTSIVVALASSIIVLCLSIITTVLLKVNKLLKFENEHAKLIKRNKLFVILISFGIASASALAITSLISLLTTVPLVALGLMIMFSVLMFAFIVSGLLAYFYLSDTNEKKVVNDDYFVINELSVYDISKLGLSFIPSDRHKHGLVLDYNIKNNSILRRLWDKKYSKAGLLNNRAMQRETEDIIEKFDVRGARNGYSMSRSLSGGNQQKFIVGREMNSPHDFILILQPTRGLDVGAIKNIHERILKEKAEGKAILLISYELDEVLSLADKIAVINTGEILAVKPAKELTRTEIGVYMAHKKGGE